jgi:hypothetical protein
MSVLETSLMPALSREMGDTDPNNYTYNADQLFSAINDGYAELNRRGYVVQFSVVGSGETAYFSPDPTVEEQRVIVLCAALVLTEGEIQKSARNSIIHSNVAGRTDLTRVAEWLLQIRDRISEQIDDFVSSASSVTNSTDTDGDTLVEGAELRSTQNVNAPNYSEGLVRTEIITGI